MSSFRPPQSFRKSEPADPVTAAIEQEVLAEKIGTHGRLLRRFEKALAALNEATVNEAAEEVRAPLVALAGETLWHLVIQRELCGFRNTQAFLRDMKVSAEVRLRMGARR